MDLRLNTLKALMAGTPPGITAEEWTPLAVSKLAYFQAVAQTALDLAEQHAENRRRTPSAPC